MSTDMVIFAFSTIGKMGLQGQVAYARERLLAWGGRNRAILSELLTGRHEPHLNGAARSVSLETFIVPRPLRAYFYAALDPQGT